MRMEVVLTADRELADSFFETMGLIGISKLRGISGRGSSQPSKRPKTKRLIVPGYV